MQIVEYNKTAGVCKGRKSGMAQGFPPADRTRPAERNKAETALRRYPQVGVKIVAIAARFSSAGPSSNIECVYSRCHIPLHPTTKDSSK